MFKPKLPEPPDIDLSTLNRSSIPWPNIKYAMVTKDEKGEYTQVFQSESDLDTARMEILFSGNFEIVHVYNF